MTGPTCLIPRSRLLQHKRLLEYHLYIKFRKSRDCFFPLSFGFGSVKETYIKNAHLEDFWSQETMSCWCVLGDSQT